MQHSRNQNSFPRQALLFPLVQRCCRKTTLGYFEIGFGVFRSIEFVQLQDSNKKLGIGIAEQHTVMTA